MIFNVSTCIQAREHDLNLCNGHHHDILSRRCCVEHHRSSCAIINRRQQVTVSRAKMRAVIRFNSRRNRFIARRGETTALLLFLVVHLSDLRVRLHHSQSSFFGANGDKAQCFQSARRFGVVGSSPDFSRVFFHGMALLGLCPQILFVYCVFGHPGDVCVTLHQCMELLWTCFTAACHAPQVTPLAARVELIQADYCVLHGP